MPRKPSLSRALDATCGKGARKSDRNIQKTGKRQRAVVTRKKAAATRTTQAGSAVVRSVVVGSASCSNDAQSTTGASVSSLASIAAIDVCRRRQPSAVPKTTAATSNDATSAADSAAVATASVVRQASRPPKRTKSQRQFAEHIARCAIEGADTSQATVLRALMATDVPWNGNRKNVLPPGETQVQGMVCGLFVFGKAVGWTTGVDRYPWLTKLLTSFVRAANPNFFFTSIQVNKNYAARPHVDANNLGDSLIIALGDYDGGRIWVEDPAGDVPVTVTEQVSTVRGYNTNSVWMGRELDIHNTWAEIDGTRLHCTTPFTGTRFSLVFYTCDRYAEAAAEVRTKLDNMGFDFPWSSLDLQKTADDKRAELKRLRLKCGYVRREADREVREQFGHCMARTWNRGWGGACGHFRPSAEVDFCAQHVKSWKTHGRLDGLPPILKQEEMLKWQRILTRRGESAPPPETRGLLLLLGKDNSMIAAHTIADPTGSALASRQVPAKKRRHKAIQSVESASVLSKAACEAAPSQQCRRRCRYKQRCDYMPSLASQMVLCGTSTDLGDGGKQNSHHRRRRCGKQANDSAKPLANIGRANCTHCDVASSGVETMVVELNVNLHAFPPPKAHDKEKRADLTNDKIVFAALPSAESTQVCAESGLPRNELFKRPRILNKQVSSATVHLSAPGAASADREFKVDGHDNEIVRAARGYPPESHCEGAKAVSSVDDSAPLAFSSDDAPSLPADFCKNICDIAFATNLRAPHGDHGHESGREAPLTPPPPSTDDATFCHGSEVGSEVALSTLPLSGQLSNQGANRDHCADTGTNFAGVGAGDHRIGSSDDGWTDPLVNCHKSTEYFVAETGGSNTAASGQGSVGCQPVAVSECVSARCFLAAGMTSPDMSTHTSREGVDEDGGNRAARQNANEIKCSVVNNCSSESTSTAATGDAAGAGDSAHTRHRRAPFGDRFDEKCDSAGQRIVMDADDSIVISGTDPCKEGLNRVAETFVEGHIACSGFAANDDADGGECATECGSEGVLAATVPFKLAPSG